MNKKVILLIVMIVVLCAGFLIAHYTIKTEDNKKTISIIKSKTISDFDFYKDLDIETIDELEISKYTEGGVDTNKTTDEEDIIREYRELGAIKLGKKTNQACEDNTTIYSFKTESGEKMKIEIECDWVVIGKDRYLIKK